MPPGKLHLERLNWLEYSDILRIKQEFIPAYYCEFIYIIPNDSFIPRAKP